MANTGVHSLIVTINYLLVCRSTAISVCSEHLKSAYSLWTCTSCLAIFAFPHHHCLLLHKTQCYPLPWDKELLKWNVLISRLFQRYNCLFNEWGYSPLVTKTVQTDFHFHHLTIMKLTLWVKKGHPNLAHDYIC